MVRAVDLTLERLRTLEVRLPPDNRLTRAGKSLKIAAGVPWDELSEPMQATVFEATRTVLEQHLIVRAMLASGHDVRERLRWLLKGADLPGQTEETTPRDVQFELVVGALLIMGGIQGVRPSEPDWRIRAGEREVGVAAKRISSRKNMTKTFRDAIGQLRRQDLSGLVIVNLDQIARSPTPEEEQAKVTELVNGLRDLARTLGAEGDVIGVMGFVTGFDWWDYFGEGVIRLRMSYHAHIITDDMAREPSIRHTLSLIGHNALASVLAALGDLELRGGTPGGPPSSSDAVTR